MQTRPDIARFDVTIVDPEDEDQHYLRYKQQSKKEGKAAQRFLATLFERHVVDLINGGAEHIKHRQHHDADDDRVNTERDIDDVGDIRTENDESGMRYIDDVEHSKRN